MPDGFEPHVELLYDLQVLAYQSDLTRVITFMYGREQTGRAYPQIGIPEPHHPLTHHQNDAAKMEKCTQIQIYHVALFAAYLEKLRTTPDGDGSLLDHVMLLYGGGISNSDRHTHGPLPTLLLGGGAGAFKGGRHLVYPDDTPLTNLQLTLLNRLGVPAERSATARDSSRSCPICEDDRHCLVGAVALWLDAGTVAHFRSLKVTPEK